MKLETRRPRRPELMSSSGDSCSILVPRSEESEAKGNFLLLFRMEMESQGSGVTDRKANEPLLSLDTSRQSSDTRGSYTRRGHERQDDELRAQGKRSR